MKLPRSRQALVELVRGVLRGHPGARIGRGVKLGGPGRYELHRGSHIARGARLWVGEGAVLTLGRGSKIGLRNIVNVKQGLHIGSNVQLSWDVQVLDTDFHWIRSDTGRVSPTTASIRIDDDVLVGTRAMILKGVTAGPMAVIGAGAVVRRDVLPGTVVIGDPATSVGSVRAWGAGDFPEDDVHRNGSPADVNGPAAR